MSDYKYVWIIEPGKKPVHKFIELSLKNLQSIVGGYIEHYPLSKEVGVICNEEGKIRDLPYNCWLEGEVFVGTIVLVGYAGEEFTTCPIMKDELMEYYPELFEREEN